MRMLTNLALVTLGVVFMLAVNWTNNLDMMHINFVVLHMLFHKGMKGTFVIRNIAAVENGMGA